VPKVLFQRPGELWSLHEPCAGWGAGLKETLLTGEVDLEIGKHVGRSRKYPPSNGPKRRTGQSLSRPRGVRATSCGALLSPDSTTSTGCRGRGTADHRAHAFLKEALCHGDYSPRIYLTHETRPSPWLITRSAHFGDHRHGPGLFSESRHVKGGQKAASGNSTSNSRMHSGRAMRSRAFSITCGSGTARHRALAVCALRASMARARRLLAGETEARSRAQAAGAS